MTFRFRTAAAIALLLPLALSGCTMRFFVRSTGTTAVQPATTAGTYYLNSICPRNAAIYRFNAVRKSRELDTLHRVAAAASTASAKAAEALRGPDAPWSSSLQPQIDLLAQSLDFDATSYTQVAAAPTLQDAWAVEWPGDTSAGNARFVIRRALGLSDGSQVDDCVGHYDGSSDDGGTV